MHVDLVPDLEGSDWGSVQGAYNLYPVSVNEDFTEVSAGFVCVVGSHKLYNEMWSERKKRSGYTHPKKHWHELEDNSPLQKEGKLILSPANSLVLWRSDLLHKNYGGKVKTELPPVKVGDENESKPIIPPAPIAADVSSNMNRLTRLTQFITFMPKKFRTEDVKLRKAVSVMEGCGNNHWAAGCFREPTVPFPAWSKDAKNIPKILPFDSLLYEYAGSSTEESEPSSETKTSDSYTADEPTVNLGLVANDKSSESEYRKNLAVAPNQRNWICTLLYPSMCRSCYKITYNYMAGGAYYSL